MPYNTEFNGVTDSGCTAIWVWLCYALRRAHFHRFPIVVGFLMLRKKPAALEGEVTDEPIPDGDL